MADLPPDVVRQLLDVSKQHLQLGQNLLQVANQLAQSSGAKITLKQDILSYVPKTYFTHHEWITAAEPIGANAQKQEFQKPLTMLVFYGQEDMQIEVNKKVANNTPVIPRYIMGNFEMEVDYVSYVLSPEYQKKGARTSDPQLYLFGFGEA